MSDFSKKQAKRKKSLYWIWGLLAVNTISAIFLFSRLSTSTPDTGLSAINQTMELDKLNAAQDKTVYQQEVSNGWAIRDLLQVIGNQNATMITNQNEQSNRSNVLLLNIFFTVGLMAVILIRVGILINDSQEYARKPDDAEEISLE
jgi:Mg2+/citrate symporter